MISFEKNPILASSALMFSLVCMGTFFTAMIITGDNSFEANKDVYFIVLCNQLLIGLLYSLARVISSKKKKAA